MTDTYLLLCAIGVLDALQKTYEVDILTTPFPDEKTVAQRGLNAEI